MGLELRCEGFCLDDSQEELLLIACRRVVLECGWDCPLSASIRLIEGRMQARLELKLPTKRVFAIVWRDDPVEAMRGAADALATAMREIPVAADSRPRHEEPGLAVSSLQ